MRGLIVIEVSVALALRYRLDVFARFPVKTDKSRYKL